EFVALRSTKELLPREPLCGGELEQVERVHESRRVAREGGVERRSIQVHTLLERDVPGERDRPTVDGERDDPRDAHRRQGPQCRPVEAEPARGHEPGAVRAAAPAKRVETKGM